MHALLIFSFGIIPLRTPLPFLSPSDYVPPRTLLFSLFIRSLFSNYFLSSCLHFLAILLSSSSPPPLSLSHFGLYSINTSYTLSLLSLLLSLSDIQTQEPDRISLVPLDLVVLLLSLPEEDRD